MNTYGYSNRTWRNLASCSTLVTSSVHAGFQAEWTLIQDPDPSPVRETKHRRIRCRRDLHKLRMLGVAGTRIEITPAFIASEPSPRDVFGVVFTRWLSFFSFFFSFFLFSSLLLLLFSLLQTTNGSFESEWSL